MIFMTIFFTFTATMFFLVAMNVSFSAHLQEKSRDLWLVHLYSFALVFLGAFNILIASRIWNT